jgi:ribosome biogenesis protein NSA1
LVTATDLKGNVTGAFRGIAGAVSQLYACESHPFVVTIGADRTLRVFENDGKRRLVQSTYLKQRLRCVIVDEEWKEEGEDVWSGIATVGEDDLIEEDDEQDKSDGEGEGKKKRKTTN